MDIWPLQERKIKYLLYMVCILIIVIYFQLIFFILVTKDKRIDLSEKQTSRNVFFCRLIGPKGAGKTSFMRKFIGKVIHSNGQYNESIYNNYVINSILIYGQKKYLIVRKCFLLNYYITMI